jgi:hypothetical protein
MWGHIHSLQLTLIEKVSSTTYLKVIWAKTNKAASITRHFRLRKQKMAESNIRNKKHVYILTTVTKKSKNITYYSTYIKKQNSA